MLEHPTKLEDAFAEKTDTKNPNGTAKLNAKNVEAVSQVELVHGALFDNFYTAYDALDLKKSNSQNLAWLLRGIELTKEMQSAIVRVGTSLISKKLIKVAPLFRYVFLENNEIKDVQLL